MGFLVVLQTLGVSIAPLLTALGVGGLAVALALQDTLANLFAGIHILASKTVQPGDYIRLSSGEEGYVVDINWRQTTVRQLSNNLVDHPQRAARRDEHDQLQPPRAAVDDPGPGRRRLRQRPGAGRAGHLRGRRPR